MASSTVNVKSDVHSLSVVYNRVRVVSPTGTESWKESWIKVKIEGAEGSVLKKFRLLFESSLQFKISTSERVGDAKASDTYYPRGKECAQLFAVLADCSNYVDMEGFDAQKWTKRFVTTMLAGKRLAEYVAFQASEIARLQAEKDAQEKAIVQPPVTDTIPPVDAPANRMQEETIPSNGKKGGRARKLV